MSIALREPANALTHFAGSVLAVLALPALVYLGAATNNGLAAFGLCVYGVSQLALYAASTLHHSLRLSPSGSERLLRLDCTLVFVYIAGTYTPICLIALRENGGWGLLCAVWLIALGGLVMKLYWLHAPIWLSTLLYVAMGWMFLPTLPALLHTVPLAALLLFALGGAVYTVGALIFMLNRSWPWPGVFEMHAIWHLCVVVGSLCFFWGIVHYVVPLA